MIGLFCFALAVLGSPFKSKLRLEAENVDGIRTHRSLDKDVPTSRTVQPTGLISSRAILGGLHHDYARVKVLGTDRTAAPVPCSRASACSISMLRMRDNWPSFRASLARCAEARIEAP